ncbi:aldehyde dehydrogenase [Phanerochaete sordida]|uniref:Aldehyde dehydrogenase n=1 Tax=Phanerochaete sordida TaxID=48140 RepID=A0A9P3FX55_9APHY|nr:aldehyde dehydrogenase [Phanerochaete sordida]
MVRIAPGAARAAVAGLRSSKLHRDRYGPYVAHLDFDEVPEVTDGREEIPVHNPATGEHLCTVVTASPSDVRQTISDASAIFKSGVWSQAAPTDRATVLYNMARMLTEVIPDFAQIESLQTGRAIREMQAQLGRLPEWLDYYASLLRTRQDFVAPTQGKLLNYVQRVPLGVVAQITPFNHPLLIAIKKLAPALAAGNSVILKPSELAPISVLEFAELAEEAGLPKGVLSILPGYGRTIVKDIISDPVIRKVDITAGTQTGKEIGSIVGGNLAGYTAELGGKAPIVVFDDADPVAAANGAAFACFVASGQTCVSGTRLLVQQGIYKEFMLHFMHKVESIRIRMGNPMNPMSTMGSVISPQALERIESMLASDQRAKILAGGKRLTGESALDEFDFSQGSFFPPTVVANVSTQGTLWREEIFGPVVVVKQFKDESDGVALANASRYGLGAALWTQDLSRAHRVSAELEAGLVWVNTHHRNDPSSPWGGMKDSGIGRENGTEAFDAYSQSKSTVVNVATMEETRELQDWFAESAEPKRYG